MIIKKKKKIREREEVGSSFAIFCILCAFTVLLSSLKQASVSLFALIYTLGESEKREKRGEKKSTDLLVSRSIFFPPPPFLLLLLLLLFELLFYAAGFAAGEPPRSWYKMSHDAASAVFRSDTFVAGLFVKAERDKRTS